ncbi:IclR family transcriptional regulator [Halobacillus shinanisalinarum]|uniref:IclR family transcriptional regulator n=1 Tax=Halobacillus shinanisalinarum TaxID=2932258 RepID=A0ABY4H011_9BACI|nr:IclR family transcriptional regulator [Halobacillus shinanisalinarum]UOQ92347.1 IclR family transcriptional regulator [Halobacillus shinanisalinarum]
MQSIDRSMKVIQLFMEKGTNQFFSISELAKECELPVSSMHRLLQAMIKHRMIQQDTDRKLYGLGSIWLEYGLKAYDTMDYISMIRPELESLMKAVEASVYLNKPVGNESIITERIDCIHQTIRVHDQLGLRSPLYKGAANLVILAYMSPLQSEKVLDSELINEDKTKIINGLEKIRRKGYEVTDEQTSGITTVAAPILNRFKEVEGSISIRVVSFHLDEEKLDHIIKNVLQTARVISGKMGYPNGHDRNFVF